MQNRGWKQDYTIPIRYWTSRDDRDWKKTLITHAVIYTHDSSTRLFTGGNPYSGGLRKIGKVKIGNNVFIGHGAVILPGITIGDYSIIGVNAVVTRDIPPNTVAGGIPAKKICTTKEYIEKLKRSGKYERLKLKKQK